MVRLPAGVLDFVVMIGHWLVAAPYVDAGGGVKGENLLGILIWTQWLIWPGIAENFAGNVGFANRYGS